MSDLKTSPRLLTVAQMCAKFGGERPLDASSLWRRVRRDPDFPQPIYPWDKAPRFVEGEVDDYIARKISERDDPVHAAAQRERVDRRGQKLSAARARALKAKPRQTRQERRPKSSSAPEKQQPREVKSSHD